jgi:hypothetical protein
MQRFAVIEQNSRRHRSRSNYLFDDFCHVALMLSVISFCIVRCSETPQRVGGGGLRVESRSVLRVREGDADQRGAVATRQSIRIRSVRKIIQRRQFRFLVSVFDVF